MVYGFIIGQNLYLKTNKNDISRESFKLNFYFTYITTKLNVILYPHYFHFLRQAISANNLKTMAQVEIYTLDNQVYTG